jgi:hypothetical protein
MSLQDVGNLDGAVSEAARVLERGGRVCIAIVHPLNSAGRFVGDGADSVFAIDGSYLRPSYYVDRLLHDGLEVELVSAHRPLEAYTEALSRAGFLIERLREPPVPDAGIVQPHSRRWQRLPLFLHLRALLPRP